VFIRAWCMCSSARGVCVLSPRAVRIELRVRVVGASPDFPGRLYGSRVGDLAEGVAGE
jgi:hypothetical protein